MKYALLNIDMLMLYKVYMYTLFIRLRYVYKIYYDI